MRGFSMSDRRTVHRVCPFCEATCGLSLAVEGEAIVSVRGDAHDPFSRGFICPKAYGLKELHHDPDRLRRPVRRTAGGWTEITWDEAFAEVASALTGVRAQHGKDAIGMYSGNPMVHDLAFVYAPVLARALGSRNLFNPAAIDTLPKEVQTGLMFGGPFPVGIPVPDIDRTHHLLIVGANPAVSHGSLMTMPDAPGRLKAVVARGGKVVVIDPRRRGWRASIISSVPVPTRRCSSRWCTRSSRRISSTSAPPRAWWAAWTRWKSWRASSLPSRWPRSVASRCTRSAASLASSRPRSPPRATDGWERACRSSARWRPGAAIS